MEIPDRLKKVEEFIESQSTQKELLGEISAQLELLNQHVFDNGKETGENSFNNDKGRPPNTGSHGLGRFSSFLPKTLKIDFPRYDGRNDPTTWIGKAEKYFSLHDIAHSDKVTLASFYLEGDALLWFQTLEHEIIYVTWEDFRLGILSRFGPTQFEDPFSQLIRLKQTSTVIEYQTRFERVLAKVGNLAQDKKVSCFVTGLRDSIRTDVQAHCPSTLTIAIGLAKLYEARDQAQKKPNQSVVRSARPAPTSNNSNFSTTTTIKRMTPEELNERRRNGLCFHCNDKYSPGHNCAKLFRIEAYWEEGDNDVEMEIEEEADSDPKISLHAMAGGHTSETMRLFGGIMGQSVMILVDSGSTHNFISSQAARRLQLQPNNKGGMRVLVASGERLESPGQCLNVPIKLQRVTFIIDFFILPLEGFDIVLGTQWLRTLGSIEWNFEKLYMSFLWDSKKVTLKGINAVHNKVVVVVLGSRIYRGNQEVLVHWKGLSLAEASWESREDLVQRYPDFNFGDEVAS
ncbi:hypothetical protein LWI29_018689 [Acer saccharum]|uniref:Chromo domain-containing protein n=1 Tax=Acer saccharum TaxID=4024 RepID=A0AA39VJD3_ACESA|nr:hypothetical protein LWI29_018689 [Acer saccharum]